MTVTGRRLGVDNQTVVYGPNSIWHLEEVLSEQGSRRPFLVTSASLAESGIVAQVRSTVGQGLAGTATHVRAHVPRDSLRELLEAVVASAPDLVLTVGGGSVTDAGKAVRAALAGGGDPWRRIETLRLSGRLPGPLDAGGGAGSVETILPQVAVPTTLSAAEFSGAFSITEDQEKHVHGSARFAPDTVLLDPYATQETPDWLWLSTGVKALDHAVETYMSSRVTPVAEALAVGAIRLLLANLEESCDPARWPDTRLDCQIGAWLSLYDVHNVSLGFSHAIGHQLGAVAGIAHGYTSCIILPQVLEALVTQEPARMASLSRAAGLCGSTDDTGQAAMRLVNAIRGLIKRLGLPTRLSQVGVREEDLGRIAERSQTDPVAATSSLATTERLALQLLRSCY